VCHVTCKSGSADKLAVQSVGIRLAHVVCVTLIAVVLAINGSLTVNNMLRNCYTSVQMFSLTCNVTGISVVTPAVPGLRFLLTAHTVCYGITVCSFPS
jgi:hypothetical protein